MDNKGDEPNPTPPADAHALQSERDMDGAEVYVMNVDRVNTAENNIN